MSWKAMGLYSSGVNGATVMGAERVGRMGGASRVASVAAGAEGVAAGGWREPIGY